MFWGVTLETGKRYSQRVEESYHLTMAALEPPTDQKKASKYVSVMVEHDKSDYMVCTLEPNRNLQVHLDLMFVEGEEVTYYLVGEGTVHLTGYLVGDPYGDFDEEDEDESSEEEVEVNGKLPKLNKRKNEGPDSSPEARKKTKVDPKVVNKESKVNEIESKTSAKKNINEKKNKVENNVNNKESEDDSEDEEESDESDVNDSLGLIDNEAVEADDSDDDVDEESDEESDDSQEPPNSSVIKEKPKQEQNQKQQPNNQKSQQNQNKQKQFGSAQKGGFGGQQKGGLPGQQKGGFGGQQKGGFGGQQKGGFGSGQKGFQQKGQWNQSGQKNQNQNRGNQWQNKGQSNQNSPNFGGKGGKQSPNFKGQQRGNFNQTPKFDGQKGSHSKQNKKQWNSDKKDQNIDEKQNKKHRKLSGGVIVEDLVEGSGPNASKGKFVHVNYVARLPNKRIFERTHNKPFSFRLGRGEVIKGWDIALEGMKVGGKRKIFIPPNMGYGNRSKGSIPANSTLEFEVELKSVT